MNNRKAVFEKMIAPICTSDFIAKYWDADFLYISRNDPQYYSNILTINDINDFLSRNDIRYPAIRMTKDGSPIPIEKYTDTLSFGSYVSEGLVNIDKLLNCYYEGATIVHQLMKNSIERLSIFSNEIENEFGFNVGTTVYLTPNKSQGFTAHYDTHSVFVLQIYGTKTWRLYDTVKDLPTLDQHYVKAEYKPTDPKQVIKLFPGDLLYVPRGMAHDAITTDGVSLHLTLGVFPHLWQDHFKTGLEKLKDNLEFRKSPIEYILSGRSEPDTQLNKLLDEYLATLSFAETAEVLSNKIINRQMVENAGRLKNYVNIDMVTIDTVFYRRRSIIFRIRREEKNVSLEFYNKTISFPISFEKVLDYIVSVDSFKPSEIKESLDEDETLALAKKLTLEGFLSF